MFYIQNHKNFGNSAMNTQTMASTASMVLRLRAAPRCHSRSKRTKLPCQAPAVRGHKVCRFHGARGGAPKGNRNAWKHGLHSADWLAEKGRLRAIIKTSRALIKKARLRVQEVVPSNSGPHLPPENQNHHRGQNHLRGRNRYRGQRRRPVTLAHPTRFGGRVNFQAKREHQTGPPFARASCGTSLRSLARPQRRKTSIFIGRVKATFR